VILTFSRDSFKDAILAGRKKTTIRKDPFNRWHKGVFIHFWRGNPRNVKANPYEFARGHVVEISSINIDPVKNFIEINHFKYRTAALLNKIAR
jgi:hypothetical protein